MGIGKDRFGRDAKAGWFNDSPSAIDAGEDASMSGVGNLPANGHGSLYGSLYGKRWIHARMVVKDGKVDTWVDGLSQGSQPIAAVMVPDLDSPLWIGRGDIDYGYVKNGDGPMGIIDFFNGALDDIRIYSRALTVDEVEALYFEGQQARGEKASSPSPPVGHRPRPARRSPWP